MSRYCDKFALGTKQFLFPSAILNYFKKTQKPAAGIVNAFPPAK